MDEEDLVFGVVDDAGEVRAAADEIGAGELALEDGELEVVAVAAHGFEHLAEAFVVRDVVTDEVGLAHGGGMLHQGCSRREVSIFSFREALRPENLRNSSCGKILLIEALNIFESEK